MAARQGIEISYSADGPWITFHGRDSHITDNLRRWVRGQMFAAGNTLQKRTLREWLTAREAEGKEEPVLPSTRKPLPASRRVPKRRAKG
jgi:hypothetical protein